jgi:hypothetical protein
MRKFGFVAAAALILAGVGGWIASTTQARVAPPMSSARIAPIQMMAVSANLPTEQFVDYSLIYH